MILFLTVVAVLISFIGAPYPNDLLLQHTPTIPAIIGLAWVQHRDLLSRRSYLCLLLFLWLHILGARWLYSIVPYDYWSEVLFGSSISEFFGTSRNHYDRLVHFASGVLLTPAISEVLNRYFHSTRIMSAVTAVAWVMTIGAIYEIFEWQLAVTMSPHMAESYNGQQGDPWDAQKDLCLALAGSIIAAILEALLRKNRLKGTKIQA